MAEFQELACSLSGPSKPSPDGHAASPAAQRKETCASPSNPASCRASDGEQTNTHISPTRLSGTSRYSFANNLENGSGYCTLAASLGTGIQPQSCDGLVPHPDTHVEEGPGWSGRHSQQGVESGTSTAGELTEQEEVSGVSDRGDALRGKDEGGSRAGLGRTGRMERSECVNWDGRMQAKAKAMCGKVYGGRFVKQWSSMTDCDDGLSRPTVEQEGIENDGVEAKSGSRSEAGGTHGCSSAGYKVQGSGGGSSSRVEMQKEVAQRADYYAGKTTVTKIGEACIERHAEAGVCNEGIDVRAGRRAGGRVSGPMLGKAFSGSRGQGLQDLLGGRDENGVYSRSMLFPSQRY